MVCEYRYNRVFPQTKVWFDQSLVPEISKMDFRNPNFGSEVAVCEPEPHARLSWVPGDAWNEGTPAHHTLPEVRSSAPPSQKQVVREKHRSGLCFCGERKVHKNIIITRPFSSLLIHASLCALGRRAKCARSAGRWPVGALSCTRMTSPAREMRGMQLRCNHREHAARARRTCAQSTSDGRAVAGTRSRGPLATSKTSASARQKPNFRNRSFRFWMQ